MKKIYVFLILSIAFGCSQKEELKEKEVTIEDFLTSQAFSDLGVSKDALDLKNVSITVTKMQRKAFVVPIIADDKSFIVGAFGPKENKLIGLKYNIQTQIPTARISEFWDKGQFEGSFTWTDGNLKLTCAFNGSKLVSAECIAAPSPNQSGLRTQYYGRTCTTDNVANCAGDQFSSQGPFSKALCVLEMPVCMAALAADCWYELCYKAS